MHPMLNTAVKAARRAGQIINRASMDVGHLKVSVKQQSDFVTEVDRAAEATIIETLREAYPQHAILAEESGATEGRDAEFQWIIDRSTATNFIHGFPQYAASIGLAVKGVMNQAVYDPTRNELFSPARAAAPNDKRIRVRQAGRVADRHLALTMSTYWPSSRK
jgi:myo-inositol-1(or 4)-monophosphatase